MTSAIRVRAAAGAVRRAGFRFGPEAVLLTSEQVTPVQLLAIATEPRLVVDMLMDGVFVAIGPEALAALGVLAEHTRGLSPLEVRDAIPALVDGVDFRAIMLAAGAQAATKPGAGTGADHPASHPGAPVPQLEPDPNPALPAAGGTSDAGVEIERAALIDSIKSAQADPDIGVVARDPAPEVPVTPEPDRDPAPAAKPRRSGRG